MEVQLEESGNKGRAFMGKPNSPSAAMTYSKAGDGLIIIDHTEVGDELRGKGAGKLLLAALVQMARDRSIKVLPLCPFAKSVFEKDASIQDVLK